MKTVFRDTALVPDQTLEEYEASLTPYTETLKALWQSGNYEAPEASINLPFDGALLKRVKETAQSVITPELNYVVVVGIGGSNLGAKAVYDALKGSVDLLTPARTPRALFLETLDEAYLSALLSLLHACSSSKEFALVVVSKSGTTMETVANAALLFQGLSGKFADIFARTVFISDEGTPLASLAQAQGSAFLAIPQMVGGRYSVFSAAGLLPLALLGVDIEALTRGASETVAGVLEGTEATCEATAAVLAYQHDNGRHIHDLFLFSPRLESVGKWYRQLLAESVGKERTVGASVARVGLTPTVSIGTTDLHSVAQLNLGGPRDKVTTFVQVSSETHGEAIAPGPISDLVPGLQMKRARELLMNAGQAVKEAYKAQELPFMSVELQGVTEHELGAYLQYAMLQTMYVGKLLNVNAFDQPAVELYKKRMR